MVEQAVCSGQRQQLAEVRVAAPTVQAVAQSLCNILLSAGTATAYPDSRVVEDQTRHHQRNIFVVVVFGHILRLAVRVVRSRKLFHLL
ncbi:hypothetical protein [Acinetobacter sp.]|uniref:hypothetical protein n=1 Tax=Acinetobacter sp. TaxID=472 RepID=UPI0033902883